MRRLFLGCREGVVSRFRRTFPPCSPASFDPTDSACPFHAAGSATSHSPVAVAARLGFWDTLHLELVFLAWVAYRVPASITTVGSAPTRTGQTESPHRRARRRSPAPAVHTYGTSTSSHITYLSVPYCRPWLHGPLRTRPLPLQQGPRHRTWQPA